MKYQRSLFAASALTGTELTAGDNDCIAIYDVFTNSDMGCCLSELSPEPTLNCRSSAAYLDAMWSYLNDTQDAHERIIYFTGHGEVVHNEYCFVFGEQKDYLPFISVVKKIETFGAKNCLFILDTCFSGAAGIGNLKAAESIEKKYLNVGFCVMSSCSGREFSREAEDGSISLFTNALCGIIQSGFDGKPTHDGMITIGSATDKINESIGASGQTAHYSVQGASGEIWLAKNLSGAAQMSPNEDSNPIIGEIQLLDYLDKDRLPCLGSSIEDLDEELVRLFAEKKNIDPNLPFSKLCSELGLLYPRIGGSPHQAAILCFGLNPEAFYPTCLTSFIIGEKSADTVVSKLITGPLVRQLDKITSFLVDELKVKSSFRDTNLRDDELEIPRPLLRELISNALAHRSYDDGQRIQVQITTEYVRIQSPGFFPDNINVDELIKNPGRSNPPNPSVVTILNFQQGVESWGRGFSIISDYVREKGANAIIFNTDDASFVEIILTRKLRSLSNKQIRGFLKRQNRTYLMSKSIFNRSEPLDIRAMSIEYASDAVGEIFIPRSGIVSQRLNIISGSAGAGKTWLLKNYMFKMSDNWRENNTHSDILTWPIYCELRRLNRGKSLLEELSQITEMQISELENEFSNGTVHLCLDGFDELQRNYSRMVIDEILQIAETYQSMRITISSRPSGFGFEKLIDAGFSNILMPRITSSQIQIMAEKYFENKAVSSKFIQFVGELDGFDASPLMVELLATVYRSTERIPEGYIRTMEAIITGILSSHDATKSSFTRESFGTIEEIRRLSEFLALSMSIDDKIDVTRFEIMDIIQKGLRYFGNDSLAITDSKAVFNDLLSFSILHESDQGHYRFIHRSMMDYLAAKGISKLIVDEERFFKLLASQLFVRKNYQFCKLACLLWFEDPKHHFRRYRFQRLLLDQAREIGVDDRNNQRTIFQFIRSVITFCKSERNRFEHFID